MKIIIAGAGPAGLTAAYELLSGRPTAQNMGGVDVLIYESDSCIGGISRTVNHNGNRIDIGGHRFFSKIDRVNSFWDNIIPEKGNPDTEDKVMLRRNRVSRIFYLRKFFDYPVSLSVKTLKNMGLARTIQVGFGFLKSRLSKKEESSLENFYINRFGRPLYNMFFEDYTEKVWGIHPSRLGSDWGSQRVKGLSLTKIVKDMVTKKLHIKSKNVETSLIEEFIYPKYGPGQLWESVADDVCAKGGEIHLQTEVIAVNVRNNKVVSVTTRTADGKKETNPCDYFISSMPIKDLVAALKGIEIPDDIKNTAAQLPYRDFITVGLLLDELEISNDTSTPTYKNRIPDTWIYIQERDVKIGRLQVFNNWSPYMVKDYDNKVWIGLEYFCNEGDELWNMTDDAFIEMAIKELEKIGIIKGEKVIDAVRIKIKKAYPSYFGSYYQLPKVIEFLNNIENLYCIGRNGQHRYNNMDHSMLTAMRAADAILYRKGNKESVWNVNTENDYHESK